MKKLIGAILAEIRRIFTESQALSDLDLKHGTSLKSRERKILCSVFGIFTLGSKEINSTESQNLVALLAFSVRRLCHSVETNSRLVEQVLQYKKAPEFLRLRSGEPPAAGLQHGAEGRRDEGTLFAELRCFALK